MMSPWPPILKQLFSEFSEFSRGHNDDLGQPSSAGLGSMGSSGASGEPCNVPCSGSGLIIVGMLLHADLRGPWFCVGRSLMCA